MRCQIKPPYTCVHQWEDAEGVLDFLTVCNVCGEVWDSDRRESVGFVAMPFPIHYVRKPRLKTTTIPASALAQIPPLLENFTSIAKEGE